MIRPEALLLSAYDIDSHQRWRKGLVAQFREYQWTVLTLPPRHFRWRIRGNPISWHLEQDQLLAKSYDLVMTTSMVDIATLRGLYPQLSRSPLVLYFHENQLAFPISDGQHRSIDPAMVNIYSAIAADAVVFNSAFNKQSFLQGLAQLIRKLPDHIDHRLADLIRSKASVICVPLEDELFIHTDSKRYRSHSYQALDKEEVLAQSPESQHELTLLWNHRVEYDKGVDQFLALLLRLRESHLPFRLILLGQRFRKVPQSWQTLTELFAEQIIINDFASTRAEYLTWVQRADIVVSTASHEFQGLAVMEACVLGCVPLVPDRLSYPEFFASQYRYKDLDQAVSWLLTWQQMRVNDNQNNLSSPDLETLSWHHQKINYEDIINRAIIRHRQGNSAPTGLI